MKKQNKGSKEFFPLTVQWDKNDTTRVFSFGRSPSETNETYLSN